MATLPKGPNVLSPDMLRTSGALLSAQTALSRAIVCEAVERTGQDPTIIDLLVRLDQAPDNRLRAVELSRKLLMSPSHISRMIDRAEGAALVERCADPDDRRASQVALTAQGRQVLSEFAPHLEAVIARVIHQTLTPSEADTLVELLRRIEQAAGGSNDAGSQ
jgi:DNA-binding MarR family transcriptional regulator